MGNVTPFQLFQFQKRCSIQFYRHFIEILHTHPSERLQIAVQLRKRSRATGLLNKICPENVDSIVEKIAAIHVEDLKQLEVRPVFLGQELEGCEHTG